MPQVAKRISSLPNYVFSVIGDRIRQLNADGVNVLRLDIGNPDLPPPTSVLDALNASSANANHHGYTGYRGDAGFRQAIVTHYKYKYGVELDANRHVLPVIGSKEGLVNLTLAYLDRGDLALIPDIGYPSYAMGTRLAGADIAWVRLDKDNGYKPSLLDVKPETASKSKILWVNYPNNPTGAVVEIDDYKRILKFCKMNDILLVSDNPYIDVTYDSYQAPSALQATDDLDHIVEFFSFSKSFNMAGWRLGAAVGSEEIIANLLKVKSNIDSGHFKPVYDAGCVALETDQTWIKRRNTIYQDRRDRILKTLSNIGLKAKSPKGAMYIWARVLDLPSSQYVEEALTRAHVSIAPGDAYGPGGVGYVRISLAVEDSKLDQALDQLQHWYSIR